MKSSLILAFMLLAGSSFAWWDATFQYRLPVNLSNAGSTLTDYQVNITLNTSSLISAGKMRPDCADLRFANFTGANVSYWMESGCNSSATRIWVKAASIPVAGESRIYAYYGKPSAASASNATSTFIRIIDSVKAGWDFNENTSNVSYDKSGNGNNATFGPSVSWTQGKYGTALNFTGAAQASTPVSTAHNPGPALTISAWIYPTNTTGLFNILNREMADQSTKDYLLFISTQTIRWFSYPGPASVTSSAVVNPGSWYYIVAMYNNSNLSLYINNTLAAGPASASAWDGTARPIGIGGKGSGQYFQGKIDEPRIYSKALTPEEMADLYNNTGYLTASYPGYELVRKYASLEPTASLMQEENYAITALLIGIPQASKTTWPSYNETFTLWIYNNQTMQDTFNLTCTGTCAYSENPATVGSYQNKTLTFTIESANASGTTSYTITATSQANASNYMSVQASLTIDALKWRDSWHDAYGNKLSRRRQVTISNAGSALSGYQANITIDTVSLISAGKMRLDCADIRFTNSTHELPFWIETGCNTTQTKLWVNVLSVPAGTSAIYMYYGNSTLPSKSNGTATFEFFDDFSGDLGKWTNSYPAEIYLESGSLRLNAGALGFGLSDIKTKAMFNPNTMRLDLTAMEAAGSDGAYFWGWVADANNKIYSSLLNNYNDDLAIKVLSAGAPSTGTAGTMTDSAWHSYSMWVSGTTGYARRDSSVWSETDPKYDDFTAMSFGMSRWDDFSYSRIDDVRVRKYAVPEPSATAGAESGENRQSSSANATTGSDGVAAANISFSFQPAGMSVSVEGQEAASKLISVTPGSTAMALKARILLNQQPAAGKQVVYTVSE